MLLQVLMCCNPCHINLYNYFCVLLQMLMCRNPCHIVSVTLNHLDAMLAFATLPLVRGISNFFISLFLEEFFILHEFWNFVLLYEFCYTDNFSC